jgi:hypothetical protein
VRKEKHDKRKRRMTKNMNSIYIKKNLYKKPMATPLATLFFTPTKSKSARPNEDPTMPCNELMMQSGIA